MTAGLPAQHEIRSFTAVATCNTAALLHPAAMRTS
jgi:hypothetical protein